MAPVRCEVHQLLKDDPNKSVVRIRANNFQGEQRIVRIKNIACDKSAYFEAICADDAYIKGRYKQYLNLKGKDLVFMSQSCRDLLKIAVGASVELEEVTADKLRSLYAIHSALSDDSNEGWIWIKPSSQNLDLCKEKIQGGRSIVLIKRNNAKPVYSEALYADPFYLRNWKEKGIGFGDYNVIFLSAWYRHLLRIEKIGEVIDLDVKLLDLDVKQLGPRKLWALLYQYPRNHPQAVVLAASMVGIIAFGLGVIGTGLGIVGIIKDWLPKNILSVSLTNFWLACGGGLVVFGFVITLLGIIGLTRRR